jgi:Flp pilus assembly pilin Flp
MRSILQRTWHEEDGVLSFEWTLVATLVVIGVVGGLAAARDVIIDELGDVCQAVVGFNQSFSYSGIPSLGIPGASYVDTPTVVTDCGRLPAGTVGIGGIDDGDNGA